MRGNPIEKARRIYEREQEILEELRKAGEELKMTNETTTKETLAKGDICYSSWGYDQTNIDFFEVVRATEKTAWLQEIGQIRTPNGLPMQASLMPDTSVKKGEVIKRRISYFGEKISMKFRPSYGGIYKWDGKPKTATYYA